MVTGSFALKRYRQRILGAIAFLALSAALASCDNPLVKVVDAMKAETLSPRIAVLARGTDSLATGGEYDFGDVCVGDVVSVELQIKNDGRRSLAIDVPNITLTMSSGSAAGTFTRSGDVPATIEPGQSAVFSCSYAPSDTAARSVSIVIPTNDVVTPQYTLTLKGKGFSIGFKASIISEIQMTTAKFTGEITDDYGSPILQRGICWSTSPYPTINDSKVYDSGTGTGSFLSILSGMTPGQSYYARAFAVNSLGTGYGSQIYFSTLPDAPAAPTVGPIGNPAGSGTLSITWPAVNGKGITYDVYYSTGGTRPAMANGPTGLSATSCTVSGLTNYTAYHVWIVAKNVTGSSGPSPAGSGLVGKKVTSISLNKAAATFLPGSSETLVATVSPADATNPGVSWTTSNGSFATVSGGTVTGGSAGSATISAVALDGQGASASFSATTKGYTVNTDGPAGGKLFYDKGSYSDGWRYMEVAPAYITIGSGQSWSIGEWLYTAIPGAGGIAVGTGKENTDAIIAATGAGAYWALACRSYSLNGYTDWSMPSKDEIDFMRTHVPVTNSINMIASSSQFNYNRCWTMHLGGWDGILKGLVGDLYGSWPVRRF